MEGKAEKTFKNLGRKLDDMMKDLDELKESLKNKYGDHWEEINRSKTRVEQEIDEFKEKHKERFEEAERNLEKAGREIKNAFEAIFAKKKDPTSPKDPVNEEKASEH